MDTISKNIALDKNLWEVDFDTSDFPSDEEVKIAKNKWLKQKRLEGLSLMVPKAFQETDKTRLPKEPYQQAIKWAIERPQHPLNLCLAGKTGVGKTRIAWNVIKARYLGTGVRCGAIGAETFTRKLFREPIIMDKMVGFDLLLLDDLGKEKTTPTSESAIFELIRERMDKMLPTIYTTNFSPTTLVQRFQQVETGEAIARRLKESCEVVLFN